LKNIKPRMHSMRTDFEFSTRAVQLRNASGLGFGLHQASPGNWVQFRPDSEAGPVGHGRVIGSVRTTNSIGETRIYLMVATLVGAIDNPAMRWISPEWVTTCLPGPPRRMLEWICGEWSDPQAICDAMQNGFLEDYQRLTGKENP
jgi:hypothetical protein